MVSILPSQPLPAELPDYQQAWQMVLSQLRQEMSNSMFETWVVPLRPLGIGALNPYARDWVDSRLRSRLSRLLEGLYRQDLAVEVLVTNGFYHPGEHNHPAAQAGGLLSKQPVDQSADPGELPLDEPANGNADSAERDYSPAPRDKNTQPPATSRKVMLQRAYGSERARVIQPERGMFVTLYFLQQWVPLIGHSAAMAILAARSMCYWNPVNGDLRNVVETEMGELAKRAAVSLRTVKDVLNLELVKAYFLRYRVRRIVTPNGVRTAGIVMQVRMDDPLTPADQHTSQIAESLEWYLPEFDEIGERDE
jgi:hypothetical protein